MPDSNLNVMYVCFYCFYITYANLRPDCLQFYVCLIDNSYLTVPRVFTLRFSRRLSVKTDLLTVQPSLHYKTDQDQCIFVIPKARFRNLCAIPNGLWVCDFMLFYYSQSDQKQGNGIVSKQIVYTWLFRKHLHITVEEDSSLKKLR